MTTRGNALRIEEAVLAAQEHPLFAGMSRRDLASAVDPSMRRGYRRGMYLFVEAEPVDACYCLLAGRVKLYITAPDGRQQILGMFGAGQLLPEAAAFRNERNGATAEVVRDTVALRFPREQFARMLREHPCALRNFTAHLERRIANLEEIVRNVALYTVPQRVARVLQREARERGRAQGDGFLFRFPWTQQELAQLVGTTRESVSRTLAEFRRDGALRPGGQGMVFLDEDRIATYMGEAGTEVQA